MARSGGAAAGGRIVEQLQLQQQPQQPASQLRPHPHQQQQQQQHVTVALLATAVRPPLRSVIGRARSFHGFRRDDSSDGEDAVVGAEAVYELHHTRPVASSSYVATDNQRICNSSSSSLWTTLRGAGVSSSRQQAVVVMAHHRPPVTARQMDIVEKQWNTLRHHIDTLGCDIFVKLFSTYPSIQTAWRPFRDRSPQDERFRETLRNHGINVLNVIGRFLQVKDNLEAGIDLLHELGQRHVTYDAKMVFADVVVQQFLFTVKPLLGDDWTDEAEQAWSDFFKFVVHVMRECTML